MRDVKSTLAKCTPAVVGAEAAVGALRTAFRKKLNTFPHNACSCVSCQCHFFFSKSMLCGLIMMPSLVCLAVLEVQIMPSYLMASMS